MAPNSAGLNGTRYTCKAETASGEIYSKTVTIQVKGMSPHSYNYSEGKWLHLKDKGAHFPETMYVN